MNPKPYSSKQKLSFFINMIICPAKKYKKSTEIIPLASLSYPLLCDVVAFFFQDSFCTQTHSQIPVSTVNKNYPKSWQIRGAQRWHIACDSTTPVMQPASSLLYITLWTVMKKEKIVRFFTLRPAVRNVVWLMLFLSNVSASLHRIIHV